MATRAEDRGKSNRMSDVRARRYRLTETIKESGQGLSSVSTGEKTRTPHQSVTMRESRPGPHACAERWPKGASALTATTNRVSETKDTNSAAGIVPLLRDRGCRPGNSGHRFFPGSFRNLEHGIRAGFGVDSLRAEGRIVLAILLDCIMNRNGCHQPVAVALSTADGLEDGRKQVQSRCTRPRCSA